MKTRVSIAGERTTAQVASPRSVAMRMQRVLAVALVLMVGVALLVWYYAHVGDDARARATSASAGLRSAVASEMKLPALEAPHRAPSQLVPAPSADGETGIVADAAAAHGRAAPHGGVHTPGDLEASPPDAGRSPLHQVAPVLMRAPVPLPGTATADVLSLAMHEPGPVATPAQNSERSADAKTSGDSLQPTVTRPAEAGLVPSLRWLLPKGSFLDCTLETAIDSTFAGLTTCILATDVFGADGRVVLMERGTKLVGEARNDTRAGQARVAVIWSEARTPSGVVLNLVSPGTDALGRAGVPGVVERHTGERFGAAVMLSVLDAGVAGFTARRAGSGAVIYNAQGTHDVATEVLRNTISIPPTIRVAPGARVMVTVVRDIDFRAVYQLVAHEQR
jgi:type IV secretion system protein VirB10